MTSNWTLLAIPIWDQLVDFLGASLNFFYQIIPNLGIAIVMLTIGLSILMFPLTLKQTRSMRAMQEIQQIGRAHV